MILLVGLAFLSIRADPFSWLKSRHRFLPDDSPSQLISRIVCARAARFAFGPVLKVSGACRRPDLRFGIAQQLIWLGAWKPAVCLNMRPGSEPDKGHVLITPSGQGNWWPDTVLKGGIFARIIIIISSRCAFPTS